MSICPKADFWRLFQRKVQTPVKTYSVEISAPGVRKKAMPVCINVRRQWCVLAPALAIVRKGLRECLKAPVYIACTDQQACLGRVRRLMLTPGDARACYFQPTASGF